MITLARMLSPIAVLPACLVCITVSLPACEIWVEDKAGDPIGNANVYFIYANGTYQDTTTRRSGFAKIQAKIIEPVTVVAGGPGLDGVVMTKVDSGSDKIQIKAAKRDGGSVVFDNGSGPIPGLGGTLNPILDTSSRTYLYGRELSINDGKIQPVTFKIGEPLKVMDNAKKSTDITIRFIQHKIALVEYTVVRPAP
ncbi:MAG: hypothetical protein L6R48_23735 [Planctomycetes bacterium]|nr:hypothetical protein [Planctomycetota bacterium]